MEPRVSLITLATGDLDRTRQFYEAIGLQPVFQNEHMVVFDMLGQSLGFYLRDNLARDMGVAPEALGTGGCTLAHNVKTRKEVAEVIAAARAAGATVLRDAHEVFWGGVIGYFQDPDGHVWEVAWNPMSPLGPDGAFRWAGYGEGA